MSLMKKNKGFSLIEIMVSVFVLGVGLLGLAKLQAASLKTNQDAIIRSQVTILASDMFESMRANQVSATAGGYILADTADPPASPATTTDFDIADWFTNLNARVPGSDASIACSDSDLTDALPCSIGSVFTITIFWNGYNQVSGGRDSQSYAFIGTL